jgi:hypothetical protein
MYILAQHFEEEQDQEVVCLITGERYVFLEGDDLTLINPKYHEGALQNLPNRFFKTPFIKRYDSGQIRVFGSID